MFFKIRTQTLRTQAECAEQLVEANDAMARHAKRQVAVEFDFRFVVAHDFLHTSAECCRANRSPYDSRFFFRFPPLTVFFFRLAFMTIFTDTLELIGRNEA